MYFKIILLVIYLFSLSNSSIAQSTLFNEGGGTPHPSAFFEIQSTSKGILIPRMSSTDRLSISSPADGLLVYQNDGLKGFYFYNGSAWDTLGGSTNVTNISNVTNTSSSGIAVIRDEKSSGTDGGTFTSGDWRTRDLNQTSGDVSFVTLSSNEFTLDSGVYVITASSPAFEVGEHQIRLYNTTDNATVAVGTIAYSDKFAASSSTITTVVSVSTGGETFRIEHRCTSTKNTTGLGIGASWGDNVYTQVKIEQL